MLSHGKLIELYRSLQGHEVLSVYVDADQHDPAERDRWRKHLEAKVADLRRELEESGAADLEGFDGAWRRIRDELRDFGDGFLPGKGWVAFATSDRLWHMESLPNRMPDLVRWEEGIRAAPYLRALKQHRPVVVGVVDRRRARLFEFLDGTLEELEGHRADTFIGDLSDVSVRKAAVRTSGQRGETSTDQAQRILEVASERMFKKVLAILVDRAGEEGFIVLGGTAETVNHLAASLPKRVEPRLALRPSLHMDMSSAEAREEVADAATELSIARQRGLVEEVLEAARSGDRGCVGPEDTEKALREMRVETLLISRNHMERAPDQADRYVGSAFGQSARVEEIHGDAAGELDELAGGIGARVRYQVSEAVPDDGSVAYVSG